MTWTDPRWDAYGGRPITNETRPKTHRQRRQRPLTDAEVERIMEEREFARDHPEEHPDYDDTRDTW